MAEDMLSSEIYACREENDKVSRVPTQAEIVEILEPLRPRLVRRIAAMYNLRRRPIDDDFIFLRTHYGAQQEQEEKVLKDWIRDGNSMTGEPYIYDSDMWWKLLDEPEHFNLGLDWQRVYKLLPELAVPLRQRFGDAFEDMPMAQEMTFEEMLKDECTVDQYQCHLAIGSVMVLFDEEFFQTNEAGLVFRDAKGIPVRSRRIPGVDLCFVDISRSFKANLGETQWWTDSVVGERYRSMFDKSRVNDKDGESCRKPLKSETGMKYPV